MERYNEPAPTTPTTSNPRVILRQAAVNGTLPLSRDADSRQLTRLYQDIRSLITESIEFDEVQTAVDDLDGHQDIKDMFDDVGNMEFVPGTRRLLDILELIDNKVDVLDALDALEEASEENQPQENTLSDDERAMLSTDSETESEIESDLESEDDDVPVAPANRASSEARRLGSEARRLMLEDDDDSDDDAPPVRRQLVFSDEEDENVSSRLRF